MTPPPAGAGAALAPARAAAPSCRDLLKACGRGDEGAFAELYDATSARVFGLALRVVRDRAQAEEVTQEAFLDFWRTAARFDPAQGQRALVDAHHRPPQGRRPGPLGRGAEPPRHGVRPREQQRADDVDRRGRPTASLEANGSARAWTP